MSMTQTPTHAAGDIDLTFGDQGTVAFDLSRSAEVVAVDPATGNLIGVIPQTAGFVLFRLLPDGQLDPSFGEGGIVQGKFGDDSTWQRPTVVRPLPDGTVFVAGVYRGTVHVHGAPAAALFDHAGMPVTDFGEQGRVRIQLEAPDDASRIQPIAAVPSERWSDYVFTYRGTGVALDIGVVICLTRSGGLATHFAQRGYTWYRFPGGGVTFYHCGVQSDGSLIVAGTCRYGALLVALDAYGELKPSFGFEGTRLFNMPKTRFRALVIRQDDRLLCVGDMDAGRGVIAGLRADGQDDQSFNDGQVLEIREGAGLTLKRAGIDASDRLVAAGNMGSYPTLYRFEPDGRPDRSFGDGGNIKRMGIMLDGLGVQRDGHIVIAGASDTGQATIKRYLGQ